MSAIQSPDFWVAIGFLLLIGLIFKPAWRFIKDSLDTRAKKIEESLNEAASLREEVQHLLADYQRKQRDAAREVDQMLADATNEAERLCQDEAEKLIQSLQRREELAEDKISQAEADAIQEVRNKAVETSILATQRILEKQLDQKTATTLLDQSIKELPTKLH
ncbi:MAG: F0F1 ATP synthase subunit B [Rhodospirillaceae bacterium]|jgi:F-type H+-transporting ATPase subunit b|nr:F0F1 ATP synthase subunit B [Rhodospirillaceae bacterium]|tara:strand:+ start:88 stop:576 length:489 start_codon:yes stop_codon:yes gene_type:complete